MECAVQIGQNRSIDLFFLMFEEQDKCKCEDHYLEQGRIQISKLVNFNKKV